MEIPILQRCVLRTTSDEAYRQVTAQLAQDSSLLSEIKRTHKTMRLGEVLPDTPTYPLMIVADLIPATYCSLSDTATVIVLPPLPPASEHSCAPEVEEDGDDVLEPHVTVALDNSLPPTTCLASQALFAALIIEHSALIRLGEEEYATTVVVGEEEKTARSDTPLLRLSAGRDAFRNLRATLLQRPSARASATWSYSEMSFRLPLQLLEVLEGDANEPIAIPTSVGQEWLTAQRLQLCPAMNDFVLVNVYGETYAEFLSIVLQLCTSHLHGRLLSEGDVVTCALPTRALQHGTVHGVDVLEAFHAVLAHRVKTAEVLHPMNSDGDMEYVPFRVVEVVNGAGAAFGVLSLSDTCATRTELTLVSEAACTTGDRTPLCAPCRCLDVPVSFERTLFDAVLPCLRPSLRGSTHTFVVHAVRENRPDVFIQRVLRQFGLLAVCVSIEAVSESELLALLTGFGQSSGAVALVLMGAQSLTSNHSHLLPLLTKCGDDQWVRLLFAVYDAPDAVPPLLAARATSATGVIRCVNPSEGDRKTRLRILVEAACQRHHLQPGLLLSYDAMAAWTAGLTYADLEAYVAMCVATVASKRYPTGVRGVLSDVVCSELLQPYLNAHGHSVVSTKLQPVRWSDVGGLEEAKRDLRELIQMPTLYPELFGAGVAKRTGLLFYGPPGCGKTLLAKAVATEMNMNFISVKGPELINQYVGETERHIRLLFQRARDNSPCIVFFDELDALAPARGAKGDAGGAIDRIVSQLLVEIDGIGLTKSDGTASSDVFIIGATNRPDLLDPSLLRPGRFDRMCYLGIPSTQSEQLSTLKALTRKLNLSDDVDLIELLRPMGKGYSGADFFALCSDAMMFAVEDALEHIRAQVGAGTCPSDESDADVPICVTMQHLVRARDQLKPSVGESDLARYEAMKTLK